MPDEIRYIADTSALINAWGLRYPIRRFAGFWDRLDDLMDAGALRSPREVFEEIKRKDDDLHEWIKARRHMFVPVDDEQQCHVNSIVNQFPGMLATGRNSADPWVVSLAKRLSG